MIVDRELEKTMRELVNFGAAKFGFVPGKGKTDALFAVRMQK